MKIDRHIETVLATSHVRAENIRDMVFAADRQIDQILNRTKSLIELISEVQP